MMQQGPITAPMPSLPGDPDTPKKALLQEATRKDSPAKTLKDLYSPKSASPNSTRRTTGGSPIQLNYFPSPPLQNGQGNNYAPQNGNFAPQNGQMNYGNQPSDCQAQPGTCSYALPLPGMNQGPYPNTQQSNAPFSDIPPPLASAVNPFANTLSGAGQVPQSQTHGYLGLGMPPMQAPPMRPVPSMPPSPLDAAVNAVNSPLDVLNFTLNTTTAGMCSLDMSQLGGSNFDTMFVPLGGFMTGDSPTVYPIHHDNGNAQYGNKNYGNTEQYGNTQQYLNTTKQYGHYGQYRKGQRGGYGNSDWKTMPKKNYVLGIMNTPDKEKRGEMLKPEENEAWLGKNARSAAAYSSHISHLDHFCEALEYQQGHQEALRFLFGQLGSRKLQDWMPRLIRRPDSFRLFIQLMYENLRAMCSDAFANYLVQKAIEMCHHQGLHDELETIFSGFLGNVRFLAKQRFGCRVLDKVLTVCQEHHTRQYCTEVKGRMVEYAVDQNANHVVQKFLEISDLRVALLPEYRGHLKAVAMDKYGCRVLQKILHSIAQEYKDGAIISNCIHASETEFMNELFIDPSVTKQLCFNQFGNYVIQFFIRCGRPSDIQLLLRLIEDHLVEFCCHKFASSVMESMIQLQTEPIKNLLLKYFMSDEVVGKNKDTVIHILACDDFGNFVVKGLIPYLSDNELAELYVSKLKNMSLETSKYGKHIIFALRETELFKNAEVLDEAAQKQMEILKAQNASGLPAENNNMGCYIPYKAIANSGFPSGGFASFNNGFPNTVVQQPGFQGISPNNFVNNPTIPGQNPGFPPQITVFPNAPIGNTVFPNAPTTGNNSFQPLNPQVFGVQNGNGPLPIQKGFPNQPGFPNANQPVFNNGVNNAMHNNNGMPSNEGFGTHYNAAFGNNQPTIPIGTISHPNRNGFVSGSNQRDFVSCLSA